MSLVERFADDITLEYSLIDRLRVRGHVLNLQTITMLRSYFQQVHHVEWIEPRDLQRLTDDFVRFVEDYAQRHHVPLLSAKPGENVVRQTTHIAARPNRDGDVRPIIADHGHDIIPLRRQAWSADFRSPDFNLNALGVDITFDQHDVAVRKERRNAFVVGTPSSAEKIPTES